MSEATPTFSIEVLELVIDSVQDLWYTDTGYRDLYVIWKACALTCRAMVPRSQFWLFRDTVLWTNAQAVKYTEILRGNPAVGRHVRILTLSGAGDDEPKDSQEFTWLSWLPLVFAPLMKNLQELNLDANIFWNCHPGLPAALTTFKSIRKLTLSYIPFSTFGHSTRFVRAFPNLRHLDFNGISWKPNRLGSPHLPTGSQHHSRRKPLLLSHLDLEGEDPNVRRFAKWLSAAKAVTLLKTLHGSPTQYEIVRASVFPSGSHLCSMALSSDKDTAIPIPANTLNHLQTLHLQMENDTYPVELLTAFAIAAPPRLQQLTVYLKVAEKETAILDVAGGNDLAAYASLNAALSKPSQIGMKMTLCLYNLETSAGVMEHWKQKLITHLPKFCSVERKLTVKHISSEYPFERWLQERDGF